MTVPEGQKASMHELDITGDECYTCLIVDTLTLPCLIVATTPLQSN